MRERPGPRLRDLRIRRQEVITEVSDFGVALPEQLAELFALELNSLLSAAAIRPGSPASRTGRPPTTRGRTMPETDSPQTVRPTVDKEDLRRMLAEILDVEESLVTDDADFATELGVDSLLALEIVVALERRYRVKLTEATLKQVTCLRSAHELLSGLVAP